MAVPRRPVFPGDKKSKKKKSSSSGGGGGGLLSSLVPSGSLAEAVEKQAAIQKGQAQQKSGLTSTGDPFQMLQDQLFNAVNSINVAPTPLEQLRQMATQQVAAQFDPQIDALSSEITSKSKRGKQSQKTARDMYGALAQDYLSELPAMTQQFAAEDEAANARYDQAQQQMQGEYDEQAAQQAAVLKRLGVQAASQDASKGAMEDQAYFQNQSELDQQNALSQLDQQQMAQTNYQQNLGSNAKMAGENTAQEIGAMLEDFLTKANSQMTSLEGQKGSAIEALLSQMQAQDQANIDKQRQQEFDNQMKLYNFQLAAQKAMGSESQNASPFGGSGGAAGSGLTTGLAGAQNYLASQYPEQPIMASNLMEQLNDVLSNKEVTQGKFVLEPGDDLHAPKYSDVGQEYMMDLLRREFEQEGNRYNTGDINATMNALLAYLGKLR